jgi:hypothetical protein
LIILGDIVNALVWFVEKVSPRSVTIKLKGIKEEAKIRYSRGNKYVSDIEKAIEKYEVAKEV